MTRGAVQAAMWVLPRALQAARLLRAGAPTILLLWEAQRQFDRSLVDAPVAITRLRGVNPGSGAKPGFVYILRDMTAAETRFKIGHRAKDPALDKQFRAEIGDDKDFALILPVKDAPSMERRLRDAFAKHSKKSDWFALDDLRQREIMLLAGAVSLLTGKDMGIAAFDPDIRQFAARALEMLRLSAGERLLHAAPKLASGDLAQASEPFPESGERADLPPEWNWESVLDEDYRSLPQLKGRAGYICIVRDTGSDRYKIFCERSVLDAIEKAFLETDSRFALEVPLVLKVDDRKSAQEAWTQLADMESDAGWAALPQDEIGGLKRAAREERTHGSIYLRHKTYWGIVTLPPARYQDCPVLEAPAAYICFVQGVQPGSRYKIWRATNLADLASSKRLALQLNNPHDMRAADEPIRFRLLLQADYGESFERHLRERYADCRKRGGWFELEARQLAEIASLADG